MNAASLAFHGFLTLVPILIALLGLLGLVGLSPGALHSLLHDVSVLLPAQMSQVLEEQLRKPASRRANVLEVVLGTAVAIWSSIEAMSALQIALDVAYEVPVDRGFLQRRLRSVPLIAATLVLGGVASILIVLGGEVVRLLPSQLAIVRPELHSLLALIRYGGALVLVVLLLSAYYNFGTARDRSRWQWVSAGSVTAAAGWALASLCFSFYLDHFGHESRDYGALAGVAVTLLWMFLTGTAVLLGAEVNRELERAALHGDDSTGHPGSYDGETEDPIDPVEPH